MIAHKPFVFTFADLEVREREFCIIKAGECCRSNRRLFESCCSWFVIPIG